MPNVGFKHSSDSKKKTSETLKKLFRFGVWKPGVGKKFQKGHKSYWNAKSKEKARIRMSGENNPAKRKEVREKISRNRKGISTNKGRILSEETKRKISLAHKGTKKPWSGKFITEKGRKIISEKSKGKNNWNWKGGITPINQAIRNSVKYKEWRKQVFERDNYRCIWCGIRGGYIEADHIKPFAFFPELRFAIDNGRTLCINCHNTTKYGRPQKL